MSRNLGWAIAVATVAAAFGDYGFERPNASLLAQSQGSGETMPGPIIEDPPGPYEGNSYVPAPAASLTAPPAVLSTFIVTYNGFTPQAQVAFQAAVDVWAAQIVSSVPIRVTANWTALASGVLGSAGPTTVHRDFSGAMIPGTWFPAAIANKMAGSDLSPTNDDIVANFNSNFSWYLGTDGNAGGNYDLMTVVLHELGHGLGFLGSMNGSSGIGTWGINGFPFIYDRFAINGASQALLDTSLFPNGSSALAAQLTGGNVFFNGLNAQNGNGGTVPRLYAPNPWQSGSSYSHLNEATYPAGSPNSLMTPQLGAGQAIHDPGSIVRGAFTDMGLAAFAPTPPTSSVQGDHNGDRFSDLLWRHSSGSVTLWLMNGAQVIGAAAVAAIDLTWQIAGSGDYNGDGRADLLWRHNSGTVTIWLMNGAQVTGSAAVGVIDPTWQIVGSGDYNGDGRADILWRHSAGAVTMWLMNGAQILSAVSVANIDLNWQLVRSGDYNGDGRADLVWRHTAGSVTIWLMNGAQVIGSGSVGIIDSSWQIVGAGDYNGDGRADLLWRHAAGAVTVWLINGTQILSAASVANIDLNWQLVRSGDCNGDGSADLVWRHNSGTVTIWFMSGAQVVSAAAISVVDPSWQVVDTR